MAVTAATEDLAGVLAESVATAETAVTAGHLVPVGLQA